MKGNNESKISESLKELIFAEHPYSVSRGNDGRWRTYVIDNDTNGRRMIAKSRKADLIDAVVNYYFLAGNEEILRRCVSLRTIFPEWLKYKELHTNADTYIMRIKNEWGKHYENDPIVDRPLHCLKKLELDEWAHKKIKENKMTKNMYYNFSIIMRQCLCYAVDREILDDNPFSRVFVDGKRVFRKTTKKPDKTQVYTKEEVAKLFNLAWDDYFNSKKLEHRLAPLAVMFQFYTGLRVGELCAAKYSDLCNGEIHVSRMVRRDSSEIVEHTKTYEDRDVILPEAAVKLIDTARNYQMRNRIDTEFIFSVTKDPLRYNEINILLKKYCARADILYRSSHKARKTYISALIDGGVNINTVRAMAGHADERTTYFNYCFDRATDEYKKSLIEKALG